MYVNFEFSFYREIKLHKGTNKLLNKETFPPIYDLNLTINSHSHPARQPFRAMLQQKGLFLCAKVVNFAPDKPTQAAMKRLFLCIIFLCALWGEGLCQNIIIGDKLPSDIRSRRWLMDLQPEAADYSCILFYHSESELCQKALNSIKPFIEKYPQLSMVIITKEEYDKAGVTLTEHLDDRIGVAFDDGGRIFKRLGVSFIPFCIICDKKRHALWCGNGAMLTAEIIDKILTTK